ncbi:hypothetical protein TNCV_961211 [Trichonephila clavipes]|uniref:Uncharacterized protein n=1 Tax=Trichonephila clavipes TaxID=2585209 RepID=A0A8X6S6A1_TRICX|nr:hypothetical protein TNCV_961211 [Trichonephila clavipes]
MEKKVETQIKQTVRVYKCSATLPLEWLMTQYLGSKPGEGMGVCKCIVPLWHGGTLNSHRTASHLVGFGGKGREGLDTCRLQARGPNHCTAVTACSSAKPSLCKGHVLMSARPQILTFNSGSKWLSLIRCVENRTQQYLPLLKRL